MRIFFAISLALVLASFAGSGFHSTPVFADGTPGSAAAPEFGGKCAMAVVDGHMNEPGNKKYSAVVNGKTYYFCSQEEKDKFLKDADSNSSFAHDRWARAHTDQSK